MEQKFYFDCAALIILLVVIEYHIRRNRDRSGKNRLFLFLALLSVFTSIFTIGDSVHVLLEYNNQLQFFLVKMLETILYDLVAPVYVFYMLFMANLQHKLKDYKNVIGVALIPLGVAIVSIVVLFIAAVFYPQTESFKEFVVEYYNTQFVIIGLIYAVVGIVFCIMFREIIKAQNNLVTVLPIILLSISITLGLFDSFSHSILFVASLCFLLLTLFGKSTEGTIDMETGFKTVAEFDNVIKLDRMVGKKSVVVAIVLINYRDILNRNGYDSIREVIVELSGRIKDSLKNNRVPAYDCFYDGNGTFYVEIPEGYEEQSQGFAEEIGRIITDTGAIGETDQILEANICNIRFPQDAEDFDTVLMIADDVRNMLHRLRVLSASEFTDTKEFEIRKQMVMIIDRAITNGYLEVYYQPIYNVKKEKFLSAEALIRLKDPEYGFVSPGVFIPLAEKTGSIHKIGSFVLEEVCKFIGSEEFENLGVEYIEINLSAAQCLRTDLIDEIETLSKKYGVNPSQINLEITETAACYSQERLLNNIRAIHAEGYTFSLDDFGTGYSNLMRMALLPIDIVKLDKTFVDMDGDDKFHIIIRDMVRLFKRMGLKILVEGIETEEMANKFIENDVEYIQGYYYSKPLPVSEYIGFLRNHNNSGSAGKNS